jgi:carboxylesterase type B
VKRLTKTENFPGSAHWDDLTYLWWSDPKLNLVNSPKIDNELKLVNKMINIWTNFAINGNTVSSESMESDWKPLEPTEESLKCLNIFNESLEVLTFPQAERLKVWDEIFNDAAANLF